MTEAMTLLTEVYHKPVLLQQVLWALDVQPGGRYIDCTTGEGSHALAILEHVTPGGQLLAIDWDTQALATARERLSSFSGSVCFANDNFARVGELARAHGFYPVHGILMDLGLSSLQLEASGRGFSFQRDEPLDMRFNIGQGRTAADIINSVSQEELANILFSCGEEPRARRIARAILEHRPIGTSRELADVVQRAAGYSRGRTHPATRTFMALRIAVNREMDNLKAALEEAMPLLGHGGRLVVIAYHSVEDRRVKQFMRQHSQPGGPLRLVARKVVRPSPQEIEENPRSRSARLRVAEHL